MKQKKARREPSSEMQTKIFEVTLPERIFKYLSKISKHTGISEEELIGNDILHIITGYPKITGIKKVGKRWKI